MGCDLLVGFTQKFKIKTTSTDQDLSKRFSIAFLLNSKPMF